ncbi:MarR family transcriptional regulator [Streptomyces pactum]|uniref:MarR family transcriptional regulator n=1 Tax=Streptomyces pactum TaxID=68249 RepID=A0ABS0NFX9_9ACTN|nr:MarR family transcriptional regulator [Streptomyces pactum]MBH5334101.1 MarR family transcriptional regulator [Streptomyces pactum]
MSAGPWHPPSKLDLLELLAAIGTAQWRDFTATAARHGLTATQAKVLAQLGGGPLPMRGLADRLVCDASNITGVVDRLEERGLVRREPSTTDRRVKHVVTTEEGRRTIRQVREEMAVSRNALDALDDEERATLHALLSRLRPAAERRT